MSINRFVLEDLASRALGIAIPPYWHTQENAMVNRRENFSNEEEVVAERAAKFKNEAKEMSDFELKALVRHNALGYPMVMPLDIQVPGKNEMWTFPWEPLITLKGKNVIVRRRVAKSEKRGTIKEYWTQDDYEINIQGMIMDCIHEQHYPKEEVDILRMICEARQSLRVNCDLLELFGIGQIVIEDYDIPFTKGENAQGFTLKAYSDDLYNLLVDEKALK